MPCGQSYKASMIINYQSGVDVTSATQTQINHQLLVLRSEGWNIQSVYHL